MQRMLLTSSFYLFPLDRNKGALIETDFPTMLLYSCTI